MFLAVGCEPDYVQQNGCLKLCGNQTSSTQKAASAVPPELRGGI